MSFHEGALHLSSRSSYRTAACHSLCFLLRSFHSRNDRKQLIYFLLTTSHPRAWVRREGCGTGTAGQHSRGVLGYPKEHHMPEHYNIMGRYQQLECFLSRCDMTLHDFQLRHPIWHSLQCYTSANDTIICNRREAQYMYVQTEARTPPSMFFLISSILFPSESWSLGMWCGRATLEVKVEVSADAEPVKQRKWKH